MRRDIKNMTVPKLKEFAKANNIPLKSTLKDDILAEIEAALKARGETPATPTQDGQGTPEASAAANNQPEAPDAQGGTQAAATNAPEKADQDQEKQPTPEGGQGTPATPTQDGQGTPQVSAAANNTPAAPDAQGGTQVAAGNAPEELTIRRVLKVTKPLVKGDDVKAVQEALIARRFGCGVEGANGIYGAQTAVAVRHFQAMNRLIVSGKVEKFTASALGFIWEEQPAKPAE